VCACARVRVRACADTYYAMEDSKMHEILRVIVARSKSCGIAVSIATGYGLNDRVVGDRVPLG
jgi:hypothetical protein